jgi:hypothetical protein
MRRHPPIALALLLTAVSIGGGGGADAAIYDDDQQNYQLNAPDSWPRIDHTPFAAHSVVLALERRLKTLKGDVPAKGEGARMLLSSSDKLPKSLDADYETWLAAWQIREGEVARLREQIRGVPQDQIPLPITERLELVEKLTAESREKVEKALLGLGNDKEVQKLLLSRFDADPKKWPTPEIDERANLGGIPAVTIELKRVDCPNLEGLPQQCRARMTICVLRKRIYRLVFWMWPQQFDPEHIKAESDDMEMNFQFIKTTAIPRKAEDKPVLPPGGGAIAPTGPEVEEKTDTDRSMSFSILKPKGWRPIPFDRTKPAEQYYGVRYDITDSSGAQINFDMFSYRIQGLGSGFNVDDYLTSLWPTFLLMHPTGVLLTYPFPTATPKTPFLTLPNFEKKIAVKRPPPPGKDKKPEKMSKDDLERLDVLAQSKGIDIGKEKVRDCWRFCMFGQATSGIGDELALNYVFSTSERTYAFRVFVRKDAREKWGADLKRCLESFKILEDPK